MGDAYKKLLVETVAQSLGVSNVVVHTSDDPATFSKRIAISAVSPFDKKIYQESVTIAASEQLNATVLWHVLERLIYELKDALYPSEELKKYYGV